MFLKKMMLVCLVGSLLFGSGCRNGEEKKKKVGIQVERTFAGSYPISVVCTTGMVADLVRNVGGDHVRVEQLMGQDVDPHLFKASSGDISKLGNADLIFYSGLHLEGKMATVLDQLAKKKPAFAVAEYVGDKEIMEDANKAHDPHLWFDVSLWNKAAGVVRDVLVAFDPQHAADYKARAEGYQSELTNLHNEIKVRIATIPRERRVLVTAHDAFRYFGRAYDIEVKGIQGISTEAEASLKDVNDLVNFIARRKIKAVFVETSINQRNMQSVIEGCQAQGHRIVVGGTLFSDAMGKEGAPEGTYVGMVRHNVDTIVGALK